MENSTSGKGRDFKCKLCPSSFNHKGNLTQHIQSHLNEKGFECNQCTHATSRSSNLARHVKAVHETLTLFQCSFPGCNYKTSQNGNLQRHRVTHETDLSIRRRFPCTFDGCDYSATTKSSLRRHIQRWHNGNREKRFECSMCSAAFYTQVELHNHINGIHVKEIIHSCSHCEYKSWFASAVNKHMRNMHGDGGEKVTQNKASRQSAKSTMRRRQEPDPNNGTNFASSDEPAPESRPSGTKRKMKTAGERKALDVLGNSWCIFTCTLCDFIAKCEQQALEHSAFYEDHVLLPN